MRTNVVETNDAKRQRTVNPKHEQLQEALANARAFTDIYIMHRADPPAIREAQCLAVQYDYMFTPLIPGDRLAGRVRYPLVGFGTENTTGGSLYYCKRTRIRTRAREAGMPVPDTLLNFWRHEVFLDDDREPGETVLQGALIRRLPEPLRLDTANSIAEMGGRVAGATLDYDRLVQRGLPGLRQDVADAIRTHRERTGTVPSALTGMKMSLDHFEAVLARYEVQAMEWADKLLTEDTNTSEDMGELAQILANLRVAPPATFREGIQLIWLYALASFSVNYGRMDVALGDLLAQDLEAGRLTEPEALSLVQALWRLMVARRKAAGEIAEFNARVVVGGKGRRNPDNADRFALLAMEASRTVVETEPQLTLRMYRGMNPALEEKAFSVLGEGRIYPMLYNDDVNIPAVQQAFGVNEEDAQSYYPYGCGEYALEHRAIGSPNCSLNLLKALEAALHNGRDARTGVCPGLETGTLESFATFEALWQAYAKQVEHFIAQLGRRHVVEYEVERETAGLNLMSLLFDGTLETGRSILDRGTRFTGSIIESFGMVNVADSLTAIKKLVYDEQRLSLEQLVVVLDNGFEGYADIHALCLEAPKYGNDMEAADVMLARVSGHACDHAMKLAPELGFDYFLLVNINNWYNVELGKATAASADGRVNGGPLANGNTPTAGMDRQGVTAMLSSLAGIPAHNHAGYSHNMKFSRQTFQDGGRKVRGLIAGYFGMGGTQAMLTVVNRQDLEDALIHPELHQNLIVRVGGFSARFVELAKDVQQDVLRRTLHE